MTGEKALQIVELAVLRARDRVVAGTPQDPLVIDALNSIAHEIASLMREWRAERTR